MSKDLGQRMHKLLSDGGSLSAERIAGALGETVQRVKSRLGFLRNENGCFSSEKTPGGIVWRVVPEVVPPWAADRKRLTDEERAMGLGWKPSVSLEALVPGEARKGDKLLVEYPERWRDSCLVSVQRVRDDGIAQVWDLRNRHFAYVDLVGFESRGTKVQRVADEKTLMQLEGD